MSKKTKIADLESSLKEINELIDKMEQGDLSLEQALSHFEKGVTLIKSCQKILQEAEQKVEILMQNNKSAASQEDLKPYSAEDDEH